MRLMDFSGSPGAHVVHTKAGVHTRGDLHKLHPETGASKSGARPVMWPRRSEDARMAKEEWALEMERNIDRNGSSKPRVVRNVRTFGDLIDLHDQDMREVGKPPRRSKAAVMA